MSDTKRTVEVIHREYSELAAQTGHIAYQIKVLQAQIEATQQKMQALNQEAAALDAATKAEVANESKA